jgi:TRAP-type C4-dicarboxylate transport system permease small subunit
MVRALLQAYYRLLRLLLTLLMAAIIVPVAMQILSRYTGLVPRYIWTEEIARFCFVWIILLGAMIAVRDDTHFDVDLLSRSGNPGVVLALALIRSGLMAAVALTFLVYGYDFALLGARQRSEIAGLPMLSIYIAWPVAGATWLLFLGERVITEIATYRARGADGAA